MTHSSAMPETPCFVIDEHSLEENFSGIVKAFTSYWPTTIVGYSVKTNALPWLVNYARLCGFRAEVVSDQELDLALQMGYSLNEIVFNGPIKGKDRFFKVLDAGGIVNIDSKRELKWLSEIENASSTVHVGLRVNINLNEICPGESRTGNESSRFGFCYYNGELERAIRIIESMDAVSLSGLHLHVNSKTRSPSVYQKLAELASEIKERYDLDLSYVDIGGGFFGGTPNLQAYSDYAAAIIDGLERQFSPDETQLIIEPGGSILATPISFWARALDVKQIGLQRVVVTEASRVWLDPTMSKQTHRYEIIGGLSNRVSDQMICGFTCMDTDRLMHLKNEREICEGDIIVFNMVGAYTYCFSPGFFIETRPFYYVRDDDGFHLVQDRDKVDDLIRRSAWLQS